MNNPAVRSSRGPAGVLLSVARAGERLVAVGERGTIVRSDDQGQSWQQVASPVSVSLTRVG
ncbi:photosystem I reaction center subunit IV, partial [Acinetobacter baumannii]